MNNIEKEIDEAAKKNAETYWNDDQPIMLRNAYAAGAREFVKRTEAKYEYVCKSCYGVGEIGHQLQDGSYENHTCPHCVGYVQEKVWQEAIELLISVSSGTERPKTLASLIAVMTDEGKRKGYVS